MQNGSIMGSTRLRGPDVWDGIIKPGMHSRVKMFGGTE